jgi:hypothetical protein
LDVQLKLLKRFDSSAAWKKSLGLSEEVIGLDESEALPLASASTLASGWSA